MRSVRLPMNPLAFDELTQLGRSIIPSIAPQWTDHNTHDPGIMLLELLSWIAEAQMYGLSRTRKDERLAFARLLGLAPRGPTPASGLVWANPDLSPAPWPRGYVVPRGTAVTPNRPEASPFFTTESVELTTARLKGVASEFRDGRRVDWTAANTHDGATFMAFGAEPTAGDRLLLEFEGRLTGSTSGTADISLGVHIAADERAANADEAAEQVAPARTARLKATLGMEQGERPVQIVLDTTQGFLRTGLLLLRMPAGTDATERAVLTLRSATGGFLRAPRVHQIAPNVLPIEQVTRALDQRRFGNGLPDQIYALEHKGLLFPVGSRGLNVTVHEDSRSGTWTAVKGFDASGPHDPHFVLDEIGGTLQFGNGVNGRVIPSGSSIDAEYSVSQGSRGNQPANVAWTVTGIAGAFGTNVVAIDGGADARGLPDLRRLARRRLATARPVVTTADLEAAALAFTDLGVTRASELRQAACGVRGTRVLLVVGSHESGDERAGTESNEFLSEIHGRIAPRLALGQRLEVIPPRYVTVRIHASIVAAPRVDPEQLRKHLLTHAAVAAVNRDNRWWSRLAFWAGRGGGGGQRLDAEAPGSR